MGRFAFASYPGTYIFEDVGVLHEPLILNSISELSNYRINSVAHLMAPTYAEMGASFAQILGHRTSIRIWPSSFHRNGHRAPSPRRAFLILFSINHLQYQLKALHVLSTILCFDCFLLIYGKDHRGDLFRKTSSGRSSLYAAI